MHFEACAGTVTPGAEGGTSSLACLAEGVSVIVPVREAGFEVTAGQRHAFVRVPS